MPKIDDVKKPFEFDEQVKEWLTDDKNRKHLLEPFEAYRQFVTQYTGQSQPDYTSICWLEIDEKRFVLLGLNSALMAGRNKDAKTAKNG
jgi:hypothetical protein